jgi:hypothetical protein
MIPGSEQPRQSHYSSPTARLFVLDVLVPVPRFPVCVEAAFQLAVALAGCLALAGATSPGPFWLAHSSPSVRGWGPQEISHVRTKQRRIASQDCRT